MDGVSAECIWKNNCKIEEDFLKKVKARPPKFREHYGALHGFEVIRHSTFVQIKPLPKASPATPSSHVSGLRAGSPALRNPAGDIDALLDTPQQHGRSSRRSTVSAEVAPGAWPGAAGARPKVDMQAESSLAEEPERVYEPLVIPKYRFFSSHHIHRIAADPGSRSGKNLRRVMSTPGVRGN